MKTSLADLWRRLSALDLGRGDSARAFSPAARTSALALGGLIALFAALAYAVNLWPLQVNCVEFGAPFLSNFRALDMSFPVTPSLRYYWIGSQGLPYRSLLYAAAAKAFYACLPYRLLSLRTLSVTASAIGLVCLYQTAALLFSRPIALLYVFLLVTSPKYLDMSRSIGLLPLSNAALAAAAYVTVLSWNNRRVAGKMLLLALLGYATLSLYIPARLILLLPVAIFALYARSDWKKLILFAVFLAALVLLGDRAFRDVRFSFKDAVLVHPEWLQLDQAGSVSGRDYLSEVRVRAGFNLKMAARYLGLSRQGLVSPDGERGEAPDRLILPVYIPFLIVGLLVSVWKRKKGDVFLLAWLAIFLGLPLLANVIPPRRIIYALNPINLMVAAGIWYVYSVISKSLAGSRRQRLFRIVAVASLCFAGAWGIGWFVFKEARPGYRYSREQLKALASFICEKGRPAKAIRFNRQAEDVIWGNPYFDKHWIDIRTAYKFENDGAKYLEDPVPRPVELLKQIDYARKEGGGILYIHVTAPARRGVPVQDERWTQADIEKAMTDFPDEVDVSRLDGMEEICFVFIRPTDRLQAGKGGK